MIRVHILGLRVTMDFQPRAKRGAPAHKTTGKERRSCIQFSELDIKLPNKCCPMPRIKRSREKGRVMKNRFLKSESSVSFSNCAEGISGSNAIPQIGQVPG